MKLREMLPDIWQGIIDSNPLWAVTRPWTLEQGVNMRALNLSVILQEALRDAQNS